jgi:hypothetical protein
MDDPEVTARLSLFKMFMSQLAANAQQRQMLASQLQQGGAGPANQLPPAAA